MVIGHWLLVSLVVVIICVEIYILYARLQLETFTDGGESLYDLMAKEAQISNDIYITKIRDADVIQSNPWIMIDSINKNATTYPRDILDGLSGQRGSTSSFRPRNYYEYSDVLYTGLPL